MPLLSKRCVNGQSECMCTWGLICVPFRNTGFISFANPACYNDFMNNSRCLNNRPHATGNKGIMSQYTDVDGSDAWSRMTVSSLWRWATETWTNQRDNGKQLMPRKDCIQTYTPGSAGWLCSTCWTLFDDGGPSSVRRRACIVKVFCHNFHALRTTNPSNHPTLPITSLTDNRQVLMFCSPVTIPVSLQLSFLFLYPGYTCTH